MLPVHLHVEGLRSFRSGVDIAFDGRDHIAIIGDTGAGKSSLLQAITYALFGRTTYSGHANQELMNDTSTQLRVVLDFVVSGQRWQVARILKRAGDGQVGGARATLKKLSDDGESALEQVEQVRVVNEQIETILGLDFEAFIRTVLLPQGEFARLLVGDSPTERAAILRQVWRTDELTAAGVTADAALADLRPVLARAEQALVDQPHDPDAHLDELQRAADAAAKASAAAVRDCETAATAMEKLHTACARADIAAAVKTALGNFDMAGATAAAQQLAHAAKDLQTRRDQLVGERQEVAKQCAEIPDDTDGLTAAQVAGGLATLSQLTTAAGDLRSHANEWRTAQGQTAVGSDEARTAVETAAQAEATMQARDAGRTALAQAAEAAQLRLTNAQGALHQARSAAGTAAERVAKATELHRLAAEARKTSDAAASRHTELATAAAQAESVVEEARRHDAAATAAHGLHEGDLCPVCSETLSAGWTPPGRGDLDRATAAAKQARQDANDERDTATTANARATSLEGQAAEIEHDAKLLQKTARLRAQDVAAILDVGVDELHLDDDQAVLAKLLTAFETAREELAVYDTASTTISGTAHAMRAKATAAQNRAKDLAEFAKAAARHAQQSLRRLTQLRDALPAGLPVTIPAALDAVADAGKQDAVALPGLEEAAHQLETRDGILAERQQQREALQSRVTELDVELNRLNTQTNEDVTRPAAALAHTVDVQRDALAAGRQQMVGADADVSACTLPAVAATVPPIQLPAHIQSIREAMTTLLETAEAASKTAAADRKAAEGMLKKLAVGIEGVDGHGDVDNFADTVGENLRRAAEEASFAARQTTQTAEAFAKRVAPLKSLMAAHAELVTACRVVGDLAAALKPGAFPKWLTLRRSRALLVYASRLLTEMTNGRYAFADLDDDQAAWLVIDNDSGLPRSPQSLSGGEQFIASLALALGIVEMMARSGGRLESLWLDEGFGALDRTNLDSAVEALATVAAGGRMVAVISHVAAVAEQVEHVLAVTASATGSKAQWLTASQRNDVASEDVSMEVAGALAGLLD